MQLQNLCSVQRVLCEVCRRVDVIVMDSSSAELDASGRALWQLGCCDGESLGVLLWIVDAGHVLVCCGLQFADVVPQSQQRWRWPGSVVCGPDGQMT